jgi:acyl carrier protein
MAMTAAGPEYQELVDWLTRKVGGRVNVASEAIDIETPLADCGIDSAASLELCADLRCEKGLDVETTVIWDHPTIEDLASYLVQEAKVP